MTDQVFDHKYYQAIIINGIWKRIAPPPPTAPFFLLNNRGKWEGMFKFYNIDQHKKIFLYAHDTEHKDYKGQQYYGFSRGGTKGKFLLQVGEEGKVVCEVDGLPIKPLSGKTESGKKKPENKTKKVENKIGIYSNSEMIKQIYSKNTDTSFMGSHGYNEDEAYDDAVTEGDTLNVQETIEKLAKCELAKEEADDWFKINPLSKVMRIPFFRSGHPSEVSALVKCENLQIALRHKKKALMNMSMLHAVGGIINAPTNREYDWSWIALRDNLLIPNKEHFMSQIRNTGRFNKKEDGTDDKRSPAYINEEEWQFFIDNGFAFLNNWTNDKQLEEWEEARKAGATDTYPPHWTTAFDTSKRPCKVDCCYAI